MKKSMMVMVIGLALATTGFAQGRGGSRSGGGHSFVGSGGHSYNGSGYSGRGFSGYRGGYGGSSFGFGFSYTPGPYWSGYYGYPYPGPYYYPYAGYGPAYYPPAYYPGPVVGIGVIGGGFVRGPAFVGRGGDWYRFNRR
ncbi:MAG: hypothetical protein ABSE93_15040 [Terriglobia bacterium]|jgi:hypothetical protein